MRFISSLIFLATYVSPSFATEQWTHLSDASNSPKTREHAVLWADAQGKLQLYGGYEYRPEPFVPVFDQWTFSAEGWKEVKAEVPRPTSYMIRIREGWVKWQGKTPGISNVRVAPIAGEESMLVYVPPGTIGYFQRETRSDDQRMFKLEIKDGVSRWIPVAGGAPFAELANFVYDQANDQYLLFCGLNEVENIGPSCDRVFRFKFTNPQKSAGSWTVLTNASPEKLTPPARYGAAAVFDQVNGRAVVFGGGSYDCEDNPVCPREDIWTLKVGGDGYLWTKLDIALPKAGRNGCHAYDPKRNRMLLVGQTPNAKDSIDGVQVFHLNLGFEKWEQLPLPTETVSRSSCSATFDALGDRFIFGYGNNSEAQYQDLWSLSF